ncbi:MAG: adenylate/guanylate cyclase domain-containing protein [Mycobacteriales bacterium]
MLERLRRRTQSPQAQRDRLERLLLGGPRRLTRVEVAQRAGVDPTLSRRLWRALGFPDAGDNDVEFTDADVRALRLAASLTRRKLVDDELAVVIARAMGHAMVGLAQSELDALTDITPPDGKEDLSSVLRQAELVQDTFKLLPELIPDMERLLGYTWRRHLAGAVGRAFTDPGDDAGARTLTVGFADLVGYTALAQELDERELGRLVDRFEAQFLDLVAAQGGRVVKTVGDEVMWVSEEPTTGAHIALALIDTADNDPRLPPVRIGMACGSVVSRHGDLYGPVVNLAARLTGLARPSSILVDAGLRAALADAADFRLEGLRRRRIRGVGRATPYRLDRVS